MQKFARLFWLMSVSILGIVPIVLAFFWVNGNMTLPGDAERFFQAKMGWPWISMESSPPASLATVDLLLILGTGLLTALSQTITRNKRLLKRPALVTVLGVCLFVTMSSWQYTGIVLWAIRSPLYLASGLYFLFVGVSFKRAISSTNIAEVFGFSQIYSKPTDSFSRSVPSHHLLIPLACAFLITPVMSVDRLLFSLVTLLIGSTFYKMSAARRT